MADKAWICDEQRVRTKFRQHNPIVLQLHARQWCNREQQDYGTKISFELIPRDKYHTLSPTRGCPKKEQFWTFTSHMHDTCETYRSETGNT
jgi:hypothetical protein